MEENKEYQLAIPTLITGLFFIIILIATKESYFNALLGIITIIIVIEKILFPEKKLILLIGLNIMGLIVSVGIFGSFLAMVIGIPIFYLWMFFIDFVAYTSPFR